MSPLTKPRPPELERDLWECAAGRSDVVRLNAKLAGPIDDVFGRVADGAFDE